MTFGGSSTFMKGVTSSDEEARAVLDRALVSGRVARPKAQAHHPRHQVPLRPRRLESWRDTLQRHEADDRTWLVLDAVHQVARELESTPARVAITWVLAQPECTSVILGARTVAQLEENLAAADLKLSADQLRRLEEVSRPAWGYPYDFIAMRERW